MPTNVYNKNQQEHRQSPYEFYQKAQPVAFDVLDASMKNHRVSHAYLFYGERNCYQEELALYFAKSLILETDGFYQVDQLTPVQKQRLDRIEANEDGNFRFYDGSRMKKIGKQEVDELQKEFSKTSFTTQSKRVYVISSCENMTYEASNSLLKFLEEPNPDVIAILVTSQMEMVIETIQSRCIPIPFHTIPSSFRYKRAIELGLDEEDAYFLKSMSYREKDFTTIVCSERYQTAKKMFKTYLDRYYGRLLLLVDYETIYKSKNTKEVDFYGEAMKDRDVDYETLKCFFAMMIVFYQNYFVEEEIHIDWYQEALEEERKAINKAQAKEILGILLEQNDQCNRFVDYSLLLFQTMYRLEEIL